MKIMIKIEVWSILKMKRDYLNDFYRYDKEIVEL
jgi:hypothetical protein